MMLFSAEGHQLGMLSGGCLESDIHHYARRVMHSQRAITLTYDGSDEDDLSFQLGIGCGGSVHILLQPLNQANEYLQLERIYNALREFRTGYYYQRIPTQAGEVEVRFMDADPVPMDGFQIIARLEEEGGEQWLCTPVKPPPHLLIVGGGIDARPVCAIGHAMGWRISVWDPRPANGRAEYFPSADALLSGPVAELPGYIRAQSVNAAVLMSHSIELDARALAALHREPLGYLALLGPRTRRDRIIQAANIDSGAGSLPVYGPAGLAIGADSPESIALSILAECQAALYQGSGRSISGQLPDE